jgi:hypothetical protein
MLIIANLWAKELEVGDRILKAELVDSRYGPIKRFTVERPEAAEVHALGEALIALAGEKGGA